MIINLIIVAIIVAIITVIRLVIPKEIEYMEGAYWLTGFQRWRLVSRSKKGIVVDGFSRLSLEASFSHCLLVCPTGGGKTTKMSMTNLLRADGASYISLDPDSSMWKRSAGWLTSEGYRVCKIDFTDSAEESLSFNPLHRVRTHRDASIVSSTLINAAFPDRGGERFWNESAEALLTTLVMTLRNCDTKYFHLAMVKKLLTHLGPDCSGLDKFVAEHADPNTFSDFKSFRAASSRVAASIVTTCQTALKPWSDPLTCRLTATESLNFESLRTEKTAIFFCFPEIHAKHYSVIGALLFFQVFSFCMQTPEEDELSIFAILDELGNSAPIPELATIMTAIRRRRVSIIASCQDLEQLKRLYGREDAHILANGGCATRIFLPGLSHSMCKDVSASLGKTMCIDRRNGQERIVTRSLLEPDAVRTLPQDSGILITGRHPAMKLRMKAYYEIPKLRSRSEIPPPRSHSNELMPVEYISIPPTTKSSLDSVVTSAKRATEPNNFAQDSALPAKEIASTIAKDITEQVEEIITNLTGPALRQAVLLNTLNNDAVVPLTDIMQALGISRDVSERLRKEKKLRPIVTKSGRNSKLYVTIGHIRHLVRQMNEAPLPARRGKIRKKSKKSPS